MEYIEKLAREHVVCKTDSPNTRQYYGELRHLLPQKKHRILLLRYTALRKRRIRKLQAGVVPGPASGR